MGAHENLYVASTIKRMLLLGVCADFLTNNFSLATHISQLTWKYSPLDERNISPSKLLVCLYSLISFSYKDG